MMSQVSGSTAPFTPKSFSEDVTNSYESDIFARLHPLNKFACQGYDATVTAIAKYSKFEHARKFLQAEHMSMRASSVFTEDEDTTGENDTIREQQWIGSFKFCLNQLPRSPTSGWYLGTDRGRSSNGEVDILLAPPSNKWVKLGVAGKHARLSFHPECCRIVLEARHTVILGSSGTKTLSQSEVCVLGQGELICIGDCTYSFEYTDLYTTPAFEESLSYFMKKYYRPQWSMNNLLSPASVGMPTMLGNYFCSPRAFDEGTFGKVMAGWTPKGRAVAIKQFKKPKEAEINSHKTMMEYIGSHDNILQLLECVSHFSTKVPDAYCVYAPLATGSLQDIIDGYQLDHRAKETLLQDYLSGLSYLHDQKHIMHRDIKPGNLAVTSLINPKGVILDLDSATTDLTSTDDRKGTISYLAPEIIAWKIWEEGKASHEPVPFDRSVDIWALGLSMYALHVGQPWRWRYFAAEGVAADRVTEQLHSNFRAKIQEAIISTRGSVAEQFLTWIEAMTQYRAEIRISATGLLQMMSLNQTDSGCGTIALKSGQKRARDE